MARLDGKVAIVTGAGSGIGRAIALEFAREGAKVLVTELHEETGRKVAAEIEKLGGIAAFLKVDVRNEGEVAAAVRKALDEFGRLDIIVNNAGVGLQSWDDYDLVLDVNLRGVYYGCKHAAEAMTTTGGGSIINIASIYGLVAAGVAGPYVVSKHAVIGLTREFALQVATQGIRVNCICPGYVETPMIETVRNTPQFRDWVLTNTPMGRMGKPEEIAKVAVFLASDDSSFMTASPVIVDGGWTAR